MENGPTTTPSPESQLSGTEKKAKIKKKASGAEALKTTRQQQAEQDLAKSLDKFSLFEKAAEKSKAEKSDIKLTVTTDKLEAPETADEQSAPAERLSVAEKNRVNQELAAARLKDWEAIAEADDPSREPVTEFLDKIAAGSQVETAFNDVATELGATEAAIARALEEPTSEAETLADDDVETAQTLSADPAAEDETEITISHADDQPVAAGDGSGPGRNTGGRGDSNGNGAPPPPPSGRGNVPTPSFSGYDPGRQPGFSGSPNTAPDPDMISVGAAAYYERRARAQGLLVGGLLGYLLGRRRGRIKTEKRLLPVQKKLTREVKRLDQDLAHKEQLLRQLTAEKTNPRAASKNLRNHESIVQTLPKVERLLKNPLVERIQVGRGETRLGLEKPARAEHLGHMLVAAEAPRAALERPNSIRQAFHPEEVQVMSRLDLLELSEKIVIEGASLRHIYESHLIGEKQLRHLVGEYLQGKDIRRDLRREMIEREIDFERDPILRDRVRSQLVASHATLDQMLEKVGALPAENQDDKRHQELAERQFAKLAKQKHQQKVVDTTMVTAVVVLAIAVVVLLTR